MSKQDRELRRLHHTKHGKLMPARRRVALSKYEHERETDARWCHERWLHTMDLIDKCMRNPRERGTYSSDRGAALLDSVGGMLAGMMLDTATDHRAVCRLAKLAGL